MAGAASAGESWLSFLFLDAEGLRVGAVVGSVVSFKTGAAAERVAERVEGILTGWRVRAFERSDDAMRGRKNIQRCRRALAQAAAAVTQTVTRTKRGRPAPL